MFLLFVLICFCVCFLFSFLFVTLLLVLRWVYVQCFYFLCTCLLVTPVCVYALSLALNFRFFSVLVLSCRFLSWNNQGFSTLNLVAFFFLSFPSLPGVSLFPQVWFYLFLPSWFFLYIYSFVEPNYPLKRLGRCEAHKIFFLTTSRCL